MRLCMLLLALLLLRPFSAAAFSLSEPELELVSRKVAEQYGFNPDSKKGRLIVNWTRALFSEPLSKKVLEEYIKPDQDVGLFAANFTVEGMPLLSDQYLRTRMEILLVMLEGATVKECGIVSGAPRCGHREKVAVLKRMLPRLSETDLRAFFEIVREAFLSRARQTGPVVPLTLSDDENVALFKDICEQVPEAERQLWMDQLARLETLNDEAYCSVSKAMYRAVLKMSGVNLPKALRLEFVK